MPSRIDNHHIRVAFAPDSFKRAISAQGAAEAMAEGFRKVFSKADVVLLPMADGGEGTVDAWASSVGAEKIVADVHDPLMRPIKAEFAYDGKSRTAVIEMAAASGLPLLKPDERDPMRTTTYGTGELMKAALDLGAREIIMGIGGSATNDGGAGMAAALGARFLDMSGDELALGASSLLRLAHIDMSGFDRRIFKTRIRAACDVGNPLTGPNGAAAVYGPQKGATPRMVRQLDDALRSLAAIAGSVGLPSKADPNAPGAGAAGGLGYGLVAFCGAKPQSGVRLIAKSVRLAERMKGCDLVVTGEGRMDSQTVNGKTPMGVAAVARRLGIPCIAICGCVGDGYEVVHKVGIDAVVPIAHGLFDPENPSLGARERIRAAAEETARLYATAAAHSAALCG